MMQQRIVMIRMALRETIVVVQTEGIVVVNINVVMMVVLLLLALWMMKQQMMRRFMDFLRLSNQKFVTRSKGGARRQTIGGGSRSGAIGLISINSSGSRIGRSRCRNGTGTGIRSEGAIGIGGRRGGVEEFGRVFLVRGRRGGGGSWRSWGIAVRGKGTAGRQGVGGGGRGA